MLPYDVSTIYETQIWLHRYIFKMCLFPNIPQYNVRPGTAATAECMGMPVLMDVFWQLMVILISHLCLVLCEPGHSRSVGVDGDEQVMTVNSSINFPSFPSAMWAPGLLQ